MKSCSTCYSFNVVTTIRITSRTTLGQALENTGFSGEVVEKQEVKPIKTPPVKEMWMKHDAYLCLSKYFIGSMYGIFTYILSIFMVHVAKCTIHGSYGGKKAKTNS